MPLSVDPSRRMPECPAPETDIPPYSCVDDGRVLEDAVPDKHGFEWLAHRIDVALRSAQQAVLVVAKLMQLQAAVATGIPQGAVLRRKSDGRVCVVLGFVALDPPVAYEMWVRWSSGETDLLPMVSYVGQFDITSRPDSPGRAFANLLRPLTAPPTMALLARIMARSPARGASSVKPKPTASTQTDEGVGGVPE